MSKQHTIYGYHALNALFHTQPQLISQIFLQSGRQDERSQRISQLSQQHRISLKHISRNEIEKLLDQSIKGHQGMIAVCSNLPSYTEGDLVGIMGSADGPLLLLVLDSIQDPHNLGACLRTANAMGVQAVIAPRDRAVGITATVHKVSAGASFSTPYVQVTNLARTLKMLQEQGVWIVGTEADAPSHLSEIDMKGNIAIVMGSEGSGMRRLTKQHCDYLARIDMLGSVESINISVATGIVLYEVARQRSGGPGGGNNS